MKNAVRHTILVLGILLSVSMVALTMMGPVHAKQPKQLVCHIDDYGEIAPKMLPAKAVAGHTAHGDPDPQTFYLDADEDMYESDAEDSRFYGCSAPDDRYTPLVFDDGLDCDDDDSSINPGADEVAGNDVDENCDGVIEPNATYAIGGTGPAGGIVFYIEPGSNGTRGLEAATTIQGTANWGTGLGCADTLIGTSRAIGSGSANTDAIIAVCEPDSAAAIAAQVGPGWFLPSFDELSKMTNIRNQLNLSGFVWSSSEFSATQVEFINWIFPGAPPIPGATSKIGFFSVVRIIAARGF